VCVCFRASAGAERVKTRAPSPTPVARAAAIQDSTVRLARDARKLALRVRLEHAPARHDHLDERPQVLRVQGVLGRRRGQLGGAGRHGRRRRRRFLRCWVPRGWRPSSRRRRPCVCEGVWWSSAAARSHEHRRGSFARVRACLGKQSPFQKQGAFVVNVSRLVRVAEPMEEDVGVFVCSCRALVCVWCCSISRACRSGTLLSKGGAAAAAHAQGRGGPVRGQQTDPQLTANPRSDHRSSPERRPTQRTRPSLTQRAPSLRLAPPNQPLSPGVLHRPLITSMAMLQQQRVAASGVGPARATRRPVVCVRAQAATEVRRLAPQRSRACSLIGRSSLCGAGEGSLLPLPLF